MGIVVTSAQNRSLKMQLPATRRAKTKMLYMAVQREFYVYSRLYSRRRLRCRRSAPYHSCSADSGKSVIDVRASSPRTVSRTRCPDIDLAAHYREVAFEWSLSTETSDYRVTIKILVR